MTNYTPQVGHRVEARIRGTVIGLNSSGPLVDAGSGFAFELDADSGDDITFERLPDPEPDWQPGDVVLAANGITYEWADAPSLWRVMGNGSRWHDADVPRPLTPLVRDGKPWADNERSHP